MREDSGIAGELKRIVNRIKSGTRARVEHVFAVVKRLWGFNKLRYRGLARTTRGRSWRWGRQTSTWRGDHCMEKSAPSGRKASRWLAERPEMASKGLLRPATARIQTRLAAKPKKSAGTLAFREVGVLCGATRPLVQRCLSFWLASITPLGSAGERRWLARVRWPATGE